MKNEREFHRDLKLMFFWENFEEEEMKWMVFEGSELSEKEVILVFWRGLWCKNPEGWKLYQQ
jgi:hypothetical protein